MIRGSSLPLVIALTLTAIEAMAQMPGQFPSQVPGQFPSQAPGQFPSAPGQFPSQVPGQFPGQAAPGFRGAEPPPCAVEFMKLREAAQKRANDVRTAGQRKATPQQACKLIGLFTDAEAKVVRYVEKNATTCGIPAEAIKGMKANHDKSLELRKRVCTAAAQAPKGNAGPSLSDTLGTSRVLDPSERKQGTGTLDTLTGNVLTR
jgi:hypothetical protein